MSNPQHEPTMEEILASIRKIISEDSTEEAQPAPKAAPQPAAAPAPVMAEPEPEDILELTDEVAEEPMPAPMVEKVEEIVFETVAEPAPPVRMPEPEPAPVQYRAEEPVSDIFTDKTRRALDEAFASIEPEEEPAPVYAAPAAPVPGTRGRDVEAVFEGAVREAFDPVLRQWLGDNADAIVERMKPVIREWLDEHFPPMLEEAVRSEVARVAKTRRR